MTATADASPSFDFLLPPHLEARSPVEAGGGSRDDVRLLLADRGGSAASHHAFRDLPELLQPGDALVVNTSATLPAAVDLGAGRSVHFSTPLPGTDEHRWLVELRKGGERSAADVSGRRLALPDAHRLEITARAAGDRLWQGVVLGTDGHPADVVGYLGRHGRPIRYGYVDGSWPLAAYQTVFATQPGSAEMPSAGRPFTTEAVTRLVARGVAVLPVLLHTGVASPEADEPPYAEWFEVPAATARLVTAARAGGGRVVAVGTTVVRALESAADDTGLLHPASGWTEVVITTERGVRVVDGLLTGFHEPRATHLAMLEAVAGSEVVARSYTEAIRAGYRWHEFGDVSLYV